MPNTTAYRGAIFYFKDSASFENIPRRKELDASHHEYVYLEDGILIVEAGKIKAVDHYSTLKMQLGEIPVIDYRGKLITPGFIDSHVHAAQSAIVAAYGEKLLEWLNQYVFPAESAYQDPEFARRDIGFFLDHLLRNGTTTAVAYGPLFYEANVVLFEEIQKRNMRFISGNTLMDTRSPENLCLPTQTNYDYAEKLITQYHGKNRLHFCITPRFALSCSESLLELCGDLKKNHPSTYIQTHLNENKAEIEAVKSLFPQHKNYLSVYDQYGLVTRQSIFGHCIYMQQEELLLLQEKQSIVAACPTSNNFLGSGLFDLELVSRFTPHITLASDWGAGNTLSLFRVMDDAYKVALLQGYKFPSLLRWYCCTLGAAKALQLEDKIGNFSPGKEADFIVIDPAASPLVHYRASQVEDIFELLFVLMSLGDERNIHSTYVLGQRSDYAGATKT